MAKLTDGTYLLTDVQWHKKDHDQAFRSLHGFTTGRLVIRGGSARLSARFNDQFLSNRLSDLEKDGVSIELRVTILESDGVYVFSGSAPTVDRSGASYMLKAEGDVHLAAEGSAA